MKSVTNLLDEYRRLTSHLNAPSIFWAPFSELFTFNLRDLRPEGEAMSVSKRNVLTPVTSPTYPKAPAFLAEL